MNVQLHKVDRMVAIEHAIVEAGECINAGAYCAALAKLRRVLDLWSARYRDEHGMTFGGKKRDSLYWRLKKIAEENKLYGATIHALMHELRLDANVTLHDEPICQPAEPKNYDAIALEGLRRPYREFIAKVVDLVSATTPGWTPMSTEGTKRYPIGGTPK